MNNSKEKSEWSKSVTVNGLTKSVNVEKLDGGGFLIKYSKCGRGEDSDEYIDITKKYYSETNPFSTKVEDSMPLDYIYDFIGETTIKGL